MTLLAALFFICGAAPHTPIHLLYDLSNHYKHYSPVDIMLLLMLRTNYSNVDFIIVLARCEESQFKNALSHSCSAGKKGGKRGHERYVDT